MMARGERYKEPVALAASGAARASSVAEKSRPIALAVLRLSTNSNCWLLYGKVGRFLALEDAVNVRSRALMQVDCIGPVGDETSILRRNRVESRPSAACAGAASVMISLRCCNEYALAVRIMPLLGERANAVIACSISPAS
jgi:hypothetical protein